MAKGHFDKVNVVHKRVNEICSHIKLSQFYSLYRYCLALAAGRVLHQDMQQFEQDWNLYIIHPNRNTSSPSGISDNIYEMPSLYGMIFNQ